MVDRLGDGWGSSLVDIAALGDLDEQGGSEGLGVPFAVEGTATTLLDDRVFVLAIPLGIRRDRAVLEPPATCRRRDADVEIRVHGRCLLKPKKRRRKHGAATGTINRRDASKLRNVPKL